MAGHVFLHPDLPPIAARPVTQKGWVSDWTRTCRQSPDLLQSRQTCLVCHEADRSLATACHAAVDKSLQGIEHLRRMWHSDCHRESYQDCLDREWMHQLELMEELGIPEQEQLQPAQQLWIVEEARLRTQTECCWLFHSRKTPSHQEQKQMLGHHHHHDDDPILFVEEGDQKTEAPSSPRVPSFLMTPALSMSPLLWAPSPPCTFPAIDNDSPVPLFVLDEIVIPAPVVGQQQDTSPPQTPVSSPSSVSSANESSPEKLPAPPRPQKKSLRLQQQQKKEQQPISDDDDDSDNDVVRVKQRRKREREDRSYQFPAILKKKMKKMKEDAKDQQVSWTRFARKSLERREQEDAVPVRVENLPKPSTSAAAPNNKGTFQYGRLVFGVQRCFWTVRDVKHV